MDLPTIWFVLIAVLWTGYFVLEGFDFGVGMLLPVLGGRRFARDEQDAEQRRRLMITTIGPVWDGNEVWVLTAGGAMFAAFPHWYATLFSGFYLPLLLILVALIVRNLGFEYRGKGETDRWRAWWDAAIVAGSAVPALLWGVAFANIVAGVPIDARMEYTGSLFTLLNPVGLLGGLTTLGLFLTHGAMYLALKTSGPIRVEARSLALRIGAVTAAIAVVFLVSINVITGSAWSWGLSALAAMALLAGLLAVSGGREGWGFLGTAATIALAVAALFFALFPDVMPSSTDPAFSLTIQSAASSPRTLTIMTWAAVVFTPVVLLYQGWTYWVFRRRLATQHIPAPSHY